MLIGIAAAMGLFHFKKLHHIVFFMSIFTAVIALIKYSKIEAIGIIITLIALPLLKPRSIYHSIAAIIGFLSYIWWIVSAFKIF